RPGSGSDSGSGSGSCCRSPRASSLREPDGRDVRGPVRNVETRPRSRSSGAGLPRVPAAGFAQGVQQRAFGGGELRAVQGRSERAGEGGHEDGGPEQGRRGRLEGEDVGEGGRRVEGAGGRAGETADVAVQEPVGDGG